MVGVLRELSNRGHQVRVASAASLTGLAAAYGLELTPVGPDFRVGDEALLVPELSRAREQRLRCFPYTRKVLVETLARAALADTVRLVSQWRPDIVIRDPVEFAGLAAAEAAGLPHVTGRENRFLPLDVWQGELGGSLAALGRAAGAGELEADCLYRYLGLAPALPSFVTATPALPDPREFGAYVATAMRFIRPRTPRRAQCPAGEVPGRHNRNAVLITFGSVYGSEKDLRTAAAAALGLPWPVIWAGRVPPGSHPGHDGQVWLDFDDVLPQCAMVVTVGGFGTIMAAMRYGIPLVIVPSGADHLTNAARCSALGVGVVIEREQLSAATLRASIEEVAADPGFGARAAELAAEWEALPDADWAASRIEELAWGGRGK
jgi:UDP:flavonoid glycosyltransferase YjiC (YdhE family)